jgi:uncharacterized protein DUF1707
VPGDPRVRASDADRDRVAALLREHHAAGRLTPEEFDERVDKALAAKTVGELDELMADLPSIDLYRLPDASLRRAPSSGRLPAQERRGGLPVPPGAAAWGTWAAVNAALFVIWLASGVATGGGSWFPWFLFVAVPWAIALTRRTSRPNLRRGTLGRVWGSSRVPGRV